MRSFFSFGKNAPAPKASSDGIKRLWLDLGEAGIFVYPAGAHDRWQDHGLGLLRTILRDKGVETDLFSLRSLKNWEELPKRLAGTTNSS